MVTPEPRPRTAAPARLTTRLTTLTLGALLLLSGCTGEDPTATATAGATTGAGAAPTTAGTATTTSPAVTPSPSSTPPSPGYTGPPPATAPVVGATTLPAVAQGSAAPFGDGLVATVTEVRAAQLVADGPGDSAGAGVAVVVQVDNGTQAPVDLGGVTVTATYGDGVPAGSTGGAPAARPTGVLAPGESGSGTWAFTVPERDRDSLLLTITSSSSTTAVLVRA